jgi:hypothetical protein
MSEIVRNHEELASFVGVSVEGLAKAIYKGTTCGASLTLLSAGDVEAGVVVGSIVEGVDQTTHFYELTYPFEGEALWDKLDEVEEEAAEIWQATHGCPECNGIITVNSDNEHEYVWDPGDTPVDPLCPGCHGEGTVI